MPSQHQQTVQDESDSPPKRASGRTRRAPPGPDKTPPPPSTPVPRRPRCQPAPPSEPAPAPTRAEDPPVDPVPIGEPLLALAMSSTMTTMLLPVQCLAPAYASPAMTTTVGKTSLHHLLQLHLSLATRRSNHCNDHAAADIDNHLGLDRICRRCRSRKINEAADPGPHTRRLDVLRTQGAKGDREEGVLVLQATACSRPSHRIEKIRRLNQEWRLPQTSV
ncbi:hypothetical protein DFH09DRAFT_1079491 [Mycena vulgaris]|nr:hypothetical protein DFH09DRAFT_1079491 [Mycena vulgaris]